jgi:hypothetical protein
MLQNVKRGDKVRLGYIISKEGNWLFVVYMSELTSIEAGVKITYSG